MNATTGMPDVHWEPNDGHRPGQAMQRSCRLFAGLQQRSVLSSPAVSHKRAQGTQATSAMHSCIGLSLPQPHSVSQARAILLALLQVADYVVRRQCGRCAYTLPKE